MLLLHDLVVTKRYRPEAIGLALASLTVAQFFTGTEVLAVTAVLAVIGAIAAVLMAPHQFWSGRRDIALGLGCALLIAFGVLAYPMWFLLYGPRHVHGLPQILIAIGGSNPSTLIHAGTHISGRFETAGGYFGRVGPSIGYAGWPLLVGHCPLGRCVVPGTRSLGGRRRWLQRLDPLIRRWISSSATLTSCDGGCRGATCATSPWWLTFMLPIRSYDGIRPRLFAWLGY